MGPLPFSLIKFLQLPMIHTVLSSPQCGNDDFILHVDTSQAQMKIKHCEDFCSPPPVAGSVINSPVLLGGDMEGGEADLCHGC